METNPDKCHLLVTTDALAFMNINGCSITNSTQELLKNMPQVSVRRQKIHALNSLNYMDPSREKLFRKPSLYLSLTTIVCMFHGGKLINRINNIQERTLRVINQDYKSILTWAIKNR